jgi:restriction endonuclease Mrr
MPPIPRADPIATGCRSRSRLHRCGPRSKKPRSDWRQSHGSLTPRSGDHGRDVIAIKKGLGSVRIIDQVKAFKPPNLVTADDVRALMGVLQGDGASKGFLTTTTDFAPRLRADPLIVPFMPARLELVNGTALLARLEELSRKPPNGD